ncbi:MAG: exported protein of unknown function [Candidatus Saccharibacteria bacterium]|nr:exported protein of unknown function [Candidatus Saccharibacteria bacterium]
MRRLLAVLTALVVLTGSSGVASATFATGTYGAGNYGICSFGTACSITISSSSTVNLNVTPASGGRCTIQKDIATVTTDDSNGYTLSLASTTTATSLTNGAATITATSGTAASPAVLVSNRWGYRVDGFGSFGAGPTSAQSSISPPSLTFAALVSSSGTADTIATTSVAASSGAVTNVWYGACADNTTKSGTYTAQVTYTAVAN